MDSVCARIDLIAADGTLVAGEEECVEACACASGHRALSWAAAGTGLAALFRRR